MPGFPFPGRPGGEHDEPLLDMIIARRVLPPDAPQAVHDLERMLAALAGPAEPGELAIEPAVRAAFRQVTSPHGVSSKARRPGHRRARRSRGFRSPARSRARLATVLVAVAGLGSVLAAYTDLLPGPIQQLAHVTFAAPAPPHSTGKAGVGQTSARPMHTATSQPGPRPDQSAVSTQLTRPAQNPTPHYRGISSPPANRRPAQPICTPGTYRAPVLPSGLPTSLPSRAPSQGVHCTGYPTGPGKQPTPNSYVR